MAARFEAIVMGGSAGALTALSALLPALPGGFSLPIALVLHVPPTGVSRLPQVLATKCALAVREPDDKEAIASGILYVAPPNYHLLIEPRRCFSLSVDAPLHFSRPSIDVLFESAADAYGPGLLGVLLTGANDDGARGLARIKAAGGSAIVQRPETAPAPSMPEAALRLAAVDWVLSPKEIGGFLARLHGSGVER